MNKLKSKLKEEIKVDKIKYQKDNIVIYSSNKKYLLAKENKEKTKYLESINCNYILKKEKNIDDYALYEISEDFENNKLEKIIEILSDIHNKSTIYYDNYNLEEYKNKIEDTINYYLKLQDEIEEMYYIRKDYYELLISISNVYNILSIALQKIEYYRSNNDKKIREVFLINNVEDTNFISIDNKIFIIDLNSAERDIIIKDISSFYKNNYSNDNIYKLFDIYYNNVNLSEIELDLFFIDICLIDKIKFGDDLNTNLKIINHLKEYIERTINFVLEKDKKYQKTDKNIFKEENKNVNFSSNED